MSISQILAWVATTPEHRNGAAKPKAGESGEQLAVALRQFDESHDRHVKMSTTIIGTLEEVRTEQAKAAALVMAVLECECPPPETKK